MSEEKPEPIVLLNQATGKIAAFACGKCHVVASSPKGFIGTTDECIAAARAAAMDHCGPWFCACGAERRQHWETCEKCLYQRQAEEADAKELARFEAAEKVSAKDWTGEYVWSERFEDLFGDIGELLGRYEDEGEEPPGYVWECEEEKFVLDAEHILESELESQEAPDGAADHLITDDQEELQDLLDGWLSAHPVKWWRPAHKRAVLIREEG